MKLVVVVRRALCYYETNYQVHSQWIMLQLVSLFSVEEEEMQISDKVDRN